MYTARLQVSPAQPYSISASELMKSFRTPVSLGWEGEKWWSQSCFSLLCGDAALSLRASCPQTLRAAAAGESVFGAKPSLHPSVLTPGGRAAAPHTHSRSPTLLFHSLFSRPVVKIAQVSTHPTDKNCKKEKKEKRSKTVGGL